MMTKYPEGTIIIREKEITDCMYKILMGSVEVYSGYGTEKEAILGILSKGSYFGEIGLMSHKPSIYTVVAYSDILVQQITSKELDDYIVNNHHDIMKIMEHMAEVMYNLKYSMDLVLEDNVKNQKQTSGSMYKDYIDKQFAKFNVMNAYRSSIEEALDKDNLIKPSN